MAHCTKCGAAVLDNSSFCAACGAPQGVAVAAPGAPAVVSGSQSQMSENVAGLLCYVLGWITGLIFYFVDKRPFVRFHAAQSIVVFGGLHIINIVLAIVFGAGFMMMGGFGAIGLGWALYSLIGLVALILWILLMVKAYQGEKFEVPVAAGIAKSIAGK